jgi:hypothetical protein
MNSDLLKVLCVQKLPAQIKQCDLGNVPDEVDSFLYKITCIKTGKFYIGIHKYDNTVYWHSSKNQDFKTKWSDENSEFRYEILKYGTLEEIRNSEETLLETIDARNNQDCWNQFNGTRKKNKVVFDELLETDKLVDEINNNKFEIVELTKVDIKKIKFKQVRAEEFNHDKVKEIIDFIELEGGSTKNCDPVIILKDRLGKDIDLGINGNHTKRAFLKSKSATKLKAIIIPYDRHKNIPDVALNSIGNHLNRKSDKVKEDVSINDVVKELLNYKKSGYVITNDVIKERCARYNFGPSMVKSTISKYKKESKIEDNNIRNNQTYSKPSETLLEQIREIRQSENDDRIVVVSSSTTLTVDRMTQKMKEHNMRKALVMVHHPNSTKEDEWLSGRMNYFTDNIDFFNSDVEIEFESISGWGKSDILD